MKKLLILPLILILAVLSVNAAGNLSIISPTQTFSGNVSQTLYGNFTLNNTGVANITNIQFSATQLTGTEYNISSSSISFTPSSVSVLSNTTTELINFSVSVPSNAYAGNYTGTINASNSTIHHDSFQLNLTVNPSSTATVADAAVGNVIQGNSGTGTFLLSNTGNTDLSDINLSVSNLVSGSNIMGFGNISLSKSSTSLNYTQTETLSVTVNVPSAQATGTYSGNITADYDGKTASGTLTVTVVESSTALKTIPSSLTLSGKLNTTITDTFTVNNTGTLGVNGITVSLSGLSEFNIKFNETSFNLAAGQSKVITLTAEIPEEKEIGTYSGTVTVGNGSVTTTMALDLRVKTYLEINDLDIEIDNENDNNVEDADTIGPDARPESHIKFEIKIKNTYSKDIEDDVSDIDNIFIKVTIEDIDDGDDLEDESDEFDLDAGDTHRETIEFDIPLEVEEGEYNVVIYIEGEDGNGVEHTDKFEITLDVDKRSHEIITRTAEFRSATVSCSRTTILSAMFMNIGVMDEDEVYYKIESPSLGIDIKEEVPYEMDSDFDNDDNIFEKTFTFAIPENLLPGIYPVEIRTYYDKDRISNLKVVYLTVEDCVDDEEEELEEGEAEEKEEEEADKEDEELETGPIIKKPTTKIIDTTKGEFFDSPTYIAILIAVNILIFGAVIKFVIAALQRP